MHILVLVDFPPFYNLLCSPPYTAPPVSCGFQHLPPIPVVCPSSPTCLLSSSLPPRFVLQSLYPSDIRKRNLYSPLCHCAQGLEGQYLYAFHHLRMWGGEHSSCHHRLDLARSYPTTFFGGMWGESSAELVSFLVWTCMTRVWILCMQQQQITVGLVGVFRNGDPVIIRTRQHLDPDVFTGSRTAGTVRASCSRQYLSLHLSPFLSVYWSVPLATLSAPTPKLLPHILLGQAFHGQRYKEGSAKLTT